MTSHDIVPEAGSNNLEIVEFLLSRAAGQPGHAQEAFGLNVAKVREIIRMPALTRLPGLARGVIGIFSFRDQLIPLIDMACWMYGRPGRVDEAKVVITEFNTLRVGFAVRTVKKIHRLNWAQVEPPDALQNLNLRNSHITGIIKLEKRLIMLVDVERIVTELKPHLGIELLDKPVGYVGANRHAVVVEDSPMIRNLLTDRLREAGFTISEFRDGQAAWDALQRLAGDTGSPDNFRRQVDVLVTDIEMPRMDGYTLIRKIKEDPVMRELPVLVFSSIITPDAKHRGEKVGADAQLSKPQMKKLVGAIDKLLTERDATRPAFEQTRTLREQEP